jgi:hypothetical protein
MRLRTIGLTLALCFVAVAATFASDPNMGTWKLNEAKSKIAAGIGTNDTVVYEAMSDNVKVSIDGTGADGKAVHTEWTGKFDGKEYAVTGDPTSDMRSYTRVNANTLAFAALKAGKPTLSGRVVVSADGKTRTVTTHAKDAKGMKITSTGVYDKQ